MSLLNGTYYGPINETPEEILLQKCIFAGGFLACSGFALQLVLYVYCVRILWCRKPRNWFSSFLLAFITALFSLNVIYTITITYSFQLTYIDYQNFPGGTLAFMRYEVVLPSNILQFVVALVISVLTDGLLLYRCIVIYSVFSQWYQVAPILSVPAVAYLGSIATVILYAWVTISPTGLYSPAADHMGLVYFSVSLSLNILLTLMIATRLFLHRRKTRAVLGDKATAHYASVMSIFIESGALYGVLSLVLLIAYALQSPVEDVFIALVPSVQAISSYLIIYRVGEKTSWETHSSVGPISTLVINPRVTNTTTTSQRRGTQSFGMETGDRGYSSHGVGRGATMSQLSDAGEVV